jgi:hypothetical protein
VQPGRHRFLVVGEAVGVEAGTDGGADRHPRSACGLRGCTRGAGGCMRCAASCMRRTFWAARRDLIPGDALNGCIDGALICNRQAFCFAHALNRGIDADSGVICRAQSSGDALLRGMHGAQAVKHADLFCMHAHIWGMRHTFGVAGRVWAAVRGYFCSAGKGFCAVNRAFSAVPIRLGKVCTNER